MVLMAVALVCLLAWQGIMLYQLTQALEQIRSDREFCDRVDTLRLPIDFLRNHPRCADRLLESMGIHTVRLSGT